MDIALLGCCPFGKDPHPSSFRKCKRFLNVALPSKWSIDFVYLKRLSKDKIPTKILRRGCRYRNLTIVNPDSLDSSRKGVSRARSWGRLYIFFFFFPIAHTILDCGFTRVCNSPITDYSFSLADCCSI